MGARGGGPWSRAKKIICALGVAFAILTTSIVAFVQVAEGTFTAPNLKPHSPIFIDGNADFGSEDGVSSGSGTKTDPFVIEGWEILPVETYGIAVNNTDAYLVIRNVSVAASSSWSPYLRSALGESSGPVGISLDNASNVKIESSFMSGLQSGVRAKGIPGVTKGIEVSRCTFTSTGQHVVVSNTSDCRVTHSSFFAVNAYVLRISNCSSVVCSFNEIEVDSYPYYRFNAKAIRIENVTGYVMEENDITASDYSDCVLVVDTEDATIANNSAECQGQYDLVAERCARILISRNEISRGDGIRVVDCSDASVDANMLHGAYYSGSPGIYASNSVDVVISGNAIIKGGAIGIADTRDSWVHDNYVADAGYFAYSGTFRGMVASGCYNLTISRNVLVNNTAAGLDVSGVNITVEGNVIHSNSRGNSYADSAGFRAYGSNLSIRYNKIFSNTIEGYSPGVNLYMCSNSTFERNNISDAVGVRYCDNLTVRSNTFDGSWYLSTTNYWGWNTTFQQNNFHAGVTISSWSYGSPTYWDAGYPYGGNYWSSYIGEDLMSGPDQDIPGPDSFGDTAYQVSGGEMDNYPRMQPVDVQDVLPPVTTAICNGTLGERMWYTSNVSVALSAFDSNTSSLDVSYSLDSGPWSTYTSEIPVAGDGIHMLQFHSEDDQGNLEETKTIEIRMDTQAPSLVGDLQQEYWFRTKTPDTRYISANFTDSQSGISYSYTGYNSKYGSGWILYSSGNWLRIIPETGIQNATIVAVDVAGNSRTYIVAIRASVAPNTNPIDHEGPYGWWLILAIYADIGVGLAALALLASISNKGPPGGRWTRRTEGERHYDEDVIDGYPKFMRKV